jgi:hypothetical protein
MVEWVSREHAGAFQQEVHSIIKTPKYFSLVKVKVTPEQDTKAQTEGRGIAVLFL